MGSDNFCLRWNDFESNVSTAFRELRAEEDLFDVTLCSGDSREIKAHKVILSACSTFFKGMLRRINKTPHPFIYLRGVTHRDLCSILDFMYHGEVNVSQDDLNSFLAVAEDLQIKGLTQGASSGTQRPSTRKTPSSDSVGPSPKKPRRSSPKPEEVVSVKTEPSGASAVNTSSADQVFDDESGDQYGGTGDESYDGYGGGFEEGADGSMMDDGGVMPGGDDNSKVAGFLDSSGYTESDVIVATVSNQFFCRLCEKLFPSVAPARRHFRMVHSTADSARCEICFKSFKNASYLGDHRRKIHRIYNRGPEQSRGFIVPKKEPQESFPIQ